ncbi:MAG: hypothetical protein PF637_07915 [Spirochaetes bacterium]|jgi:metal-responsive CopG/Arc/MetJ family transcriptional regulator|nr:hypothetical protein [Spirochaetota bacterium]
MSRQRLINLLKREELRFGLFLIVIMFLLSAFGYIFTSYLQSRSVYNNSRILSLITLPSFTMNRINRLIYSDSVEKRLAGYYSVLDTGIYDRDALLKRFQMETNESVRKAIIFIVYYSEKENARPVLQKLASESDEVIRAYVESLLNPGETPVYNSSIKF